MALSDPLGDMLTRIRNGQKARKAEVLSPSSKLRRSVLDVLKREGYILGWHEDEEGQLHITPKYFEGRGAIQLIERVSTPGRRVHAAIKKLPRVSNGLGISILSTPRGVMSDNEARSANVGGEVLCKVY